MKHFCHFRVILIVKLFRIESCDDQLKGFYFYVETQKRIYNFNLEQFEYGFWIWWAVIWNEVVLFSIEFDLFIILFVVSDLVIAYVLHHWLTTNEQTDWLRSNRCCGSNGDEKMINNSSSRSNNRSIVQLCTECSHSIKHWKKKQKNQNE